MFVDWIRDQDALRLFPYSGYRPAPLLWLSEAAFRRNGWCHSVNHCEPANQAENGIPVKSSASGVYIASVMLLWSSRRLDGGG